GNPTVSGSTDTYTLTLDSNGQATVIFTSPTAGQVTGNAYVTLDVGGVSLTRDTDPTTTATAGPGGTRPAVKTFEDAYVVIGPNGTNPINKNHTFTATVYENLGDGNGYVLAPDGTTVVVTLTNSNGASANPAGPFTLTTSGGTGQVSVTFTS